jgi:dolichol-phosphate mannosyltransferase
MNPVPPVTKTRWPSAGVTPAGDIAGAILPPLVGPGGKEIDGATRDLQLVSIVAPMYNEAEIVHEFYRRVCAAVDGLPFEIVISNNASTDGTTELLDQLADADSRVKVVHLSRNFGHQASLTAGLEHAKGDAVVMIDGDLQDPPELIPELLDRWKAGADVVYAVREERLGEKRLKLSTAQWFYGLFSRIAGVELRQNSGDFRLLDRRALDALLAMPERNRFVRGMTAWIGFTQIGVGYRRQPRAAGETKYSPRALLRFGFDAIASFSHMPLQLATALGFAISLLAFLGLPLVVIARILGIYVAGVPSLLFVMLLLGGIQLITVGIIGEYVGRIYDEVKRRPLYIVARRRNDVSQESQEPLERVELASR